MQNGYADARTTEPLLQELEAVIAKCLAANVDPDWIMVAVESKVYHEPGMIEPDFYG